MLYGALVVALGASLAGCSGDDTPTPASTTETASPTATEALGSGTLAITFKMSEQDVRRMDEPPKGTFYGSIYRAEDVADGEAVDGAEPLESLRLQDVDIPPEGGRPTRQSWLSEALPAGGVIILGFLDSDGNASGGDPAPDDGDPRSRDVDNAFLVIANVERAAEVRLTLPMDDPQGGGEGGAALRPGAE